MGFTIRSDGVFPQGGQLYFEYSSTGVTNTQAETVFRNQAGFNGATHTGENRLTPVPHEQREIRSEKQHHGRQRP